MAAKKFYAVKKGKKTGIFESWDACKSVIDGYSGAEYKGFATLKEAKEYLGIRLDECEEEIMQGSKLRGESNSQEKAPAVQMDADTMIAYVDGSYEHSLLKYAFGGVFLLPDGSVYVENGSGNDPESAKLRNVTGEMLGAMFAVRWAIKNGFSKIEIRYDYEGVEKWVTGAWKSKTELTQKYAAAMCKWSQQIQLKFTKVLAHSNVYYNEMADQLAKKALEDKEGVPEIRKKEEMEPWNQQD